MRSLLAATLVLGPISLFLGAHTASAEADVTACQPLTTENQSECCNDPRWNEIIADGDKQFCAPRYQDDQVRLGRNLKSRAAQTDVDVDVTGSVSKPKSPRNGTNPSSGTDNTGSAPDDDANLGNPGNGKDVGRAGEKGMDKGDSPKGTRGNSN